jgi:hypothetical protein
MIAAIILVWSITENWTQNPDRFSWFSALFKAARCGHVTIVAFNARGGLSHRLDVLLNPLQIAIR